MFSNWCDDNCDLLAIGISSVVGRDFGLRKDGDESFRFEALVLRNDMLSSVLPV